MENFFELKLRCTLLLSIIGVYNSRYTAQNSAWTSIKFFSISLLAKHYLHSLTFKVKLFADQYCLIFSNIKLSNLSFFVSYKLKY